MNSVSSWLRRWSWRQRALRHDPERAQSFAPGLAVQSVGPPQAFQMDLHHQDGAGFISRVDLADPRADRPGGFAQLGDSLAGRKTPLDLGFGGEADALKVFIAEVAHVGWRTKPACAAPSAVIAANAVPLHGRSAAALAGPLGQSGTRDDFPAG